MHHCVEAHKEAVAAQSARDLLVAVDLPVLCSLFPQQVFVGEVAPAAMPTLSFSTSFIIKMSAKILLVELRGIRREVCTCLFEHRNGGLPIHSTAALTH